MDVQLLNYLKTYLTERRTKLFQEVLAQRTRHITVVTEDVYQMHNTSAVMRSCDVFGIQDLHVVEARNGKRIDKEIAMGAQKWVNLYRYGSIESCMAKLKGDGYQIVATTPHAHDRTLERFEVGKKSAVFFGREDTGLSESVMNAADVTLKIPMYGFTESLNISVSAAIVLQHIVSKLRASSVAWQLTEAERLEIELEWAKRTIKSSEAITAHFYKKIKT